MSTDAKTCACGAPATRLELLEPPRIESSDGKVIVSQQSRHWCDEHWPYGDSTIMRIERQGTR